MSEIPRLRNLETPRQKLYRELIRSIEILHRELGKSERYVTEVQERLLGASQTGKMPTGPIYFDMVMGDGTLDSYQYSDEIRPQEGASFIEALTLKRQDRTLFLQYGRSTNKNKPVSIAELSIGDDQYFGKDALARVHEAFPLFYPVSQPAAKAA